MCFHSLSMYVTFSFSLSVSLPLYRTLQELTFEGHPTAMTSPGGIRDNSLWKRLEHQPPTVLNEVPPPPPTQSPSPPTAVSMINYLFN